MTAATNGGETGEKGAGNPSPREDPGSSPPGVHDLQPWQLRSSKTLGGERVLPPWLTPAKLKILESFLLTDPAMIKKLNREGRLKEFLEDQFRLWLRRGQIEGPSRMD